MVFAECISGVRAEGLIVCRQCLSAREIILCGQRIISPANAPSRAKNTRALRPIRRGRYDVEDRESAHRNRAVEKATARANAGCAQGRKASARKTAERKTVERKSLRARNKILCEQRMFRQQTLHLARKIDCVRRVRPGKTLALTSFIVAASRVRVSLPN